MLADEPTGSLDALNANKIMDLLVELNESKNITIILVTHSEDVASRCHRVVRLKKC